MRNLLICDFDGTITENDNIIEIMKHYSPQGWEAIKNAVLSREISVKEGVGKMFALLPSDEKDSIIQFVQKTASIRNGFKEFVEYAKAAGFELYIVSGGIDFFVLPMLDGLIEEVPVYCNSASFENHFIEILWPHSCDSSCKNDCGCCKPSIIRKLKGEGDTVTVIGDSVTDLEAAKQADFVIARDYLLDECQKLSLRHEAFADFHDVIQILGKRRVLA